jgi:hypothetical protein
MLVKPFAKPQPRSSTCGSSLEGARGLKRVSESVPESGPRSELIVEAAKMSASIFAHLISATSQTATITAWPNPSTTRPYPGGKNSDGFGQRRIDGEDALLRQIVEQRLRVDEVARFEAFGEPLVDRSEELAGFGALA